MISDAKATAALADWATVRSVGDDSSLKYIWQDHEQQTAANMAPRFRLNSANRSRFAPGAY
jgi:hypothetical protein